MADSTGGSDSRSQALDRLKQKRALRGTAGSFVVVAAILVVIWAVAGGGFFWPVFPMIGMALALGFQAWGVYGQKPITDADVDREVQREQGGG